MKKLLLSVVLLSTLISCKKESSEKSVSTAQIAAFQPEMEENAVLYEVNIRQYSPEGTFNAFTKDIPQLKELGIKIIYLITTLIIIAKTKTIS